MAAALGESSASLYPTYTYGGSSANINQIATKNLIYPLTSGGSNGNLVDANYAGLMMTSGGVALPKSSVDMSVKGLASSFLAGPSVGSLFASDSNVIGSPTSTSTSSLAKGTFFTHFISI